MKHFLFIIFGFITPITANAAGLADVGGGTATAIWSQVCTMLPYCGQGIGGIGIITTKVSNIVMLTIGPAAVLIILYASIRLITSAGNDETVRKVWKEMILYAVLGLILASISVVLVHWIYRLVAGIVSV